MKIKLNKKLILENLSLGQKIGVGAAGLAGAAWGANEAFDAVHNGAIAGVEHSVGNTISNVTSDASNFLKGVENPHELQDKIKNLGVDIHDGLNKEELAKLQKAFPNTYNQFKDSGHLDKITNLLNTKAEKTQALLELNKADNLAPHNQVHVNTPGIYSNPEDAAAYKALTGHNPPVPADNTNTADNADAYKHAKDNYLAARNKYEAANFNIGKDVINNLHGFGNALKVPAYAMGAGAALGGTAAGTLAYNAMNKNNSKQQ